MGFWVYENWTNARKVTLHAGHCGFCKEGRGRSGKRTRPENGRWLGPFESLDADRAAAEALPPAVISEHGCCAKANSNSSVPGSSGQLELATLRRR